MTRGLSAPQNDSCDHFVLITQNGQLLLLIREEQIHQCLLTEKVMAVRMVMTRMMARMTTRMRFWMILGESRGGETSHTGQPGTFYGGHARPHPLTRPRVAGWGWGAQCVCVCVCVCVCARVRAHMLALETMQISGSPNDPQANEWLYSNRHTAPEKCLRSS